MNTSNTFKPTSKVFVLSVTAAWSSQLTQFSGSRQEYVDFIVFMGISTLDKKGTQSENKFNLRQSVNDFNTKSEKFNGI